MSKEQKKPPFGAGHAKAFWRQGWTELRNAVFPDSNIAPRHVEMGIYGTATPSEVTDQKNSDKDKGGKDKGTVHGERGKQDNVLDRHNYGPSTPADREPPAIEPE